jgi:predicted ATPase
MSGYITTIQAKGIFDRFDFNLSFKSGINIIHARNGAGKTTLLHIIANALNGDFTRFVYLKFEEINLFMEGVDYPKHIRISRHFQDDREMISVWVDGKKRDNIPVAKALRKKMSSNMEIVQLSLFNDDEVVTDEDISARSNESIIPTSYFPAFRTMIEAWSNTLDIEGGNRRGRAGENYGETIDRLSRLGLSRREARFQALSTQEARQAFGEFVPLINYPSPAEIKIALDSEIQRAIIDIATKDRELLSKVFVDVFTSLSTPSSSEDSTSGGETDSILSQIQQLLSENQQDSLIEVDQTNIYRRLREAVNSVTFDTNVKFAVPILEVYLQSLEESAVSRADAFRNIELYLNSVNQFFNEKELVYYIREINRRPTIGVRFNDGEKLDGLNTLSSGERQIATLIYAATRMSAQQIVLIDEPEISLHIDWQRILLENMARQLGDRQIIVCTHSPPIGANYLDKMIELRPHFSHR